MGKESSLVIKAQKSELGILTIILKSWVWLQNQSTGQGEATDLRGPFLLIHCLPNQTTVNSWLSKRPCLKGRRWRATDKAIQSPSLTTMYIHMTTYTNACIYVHMYTYYYVLVAVGVVIDAVESHLPLKDILWKITKSMCVYSCPFHISKH